MKDEKKKKERFEITELFMAKCGKNGWDRCYYGTIHREKDEAGNEVSVNGNIYLKDEGNIWSRDANQWVMGENLDTILELRLDYGLHLDPGVKSIIAEDDFFHN
jgi:hypothetical protein